MSYENVIGKKITDIETVQGLFFVTLEDGTKLDFRAVPSIEWDCKVLLDLLVPVKENYSTDEAAKILCITTPVLRNLHNKGIIPGGKQVAGQLVFDAKAIDAYKVRISNNILGSFGL